MGNRFRQDFEERRCVRLVSVRDRRGAWAEEVFDGAGSVRPRFALLRSMKAQTQWRTWCGVFDKSHEVSNVL